MRIRSVTALLLSSAFLLAFAAPAAAQSTKSEVGLSYSFLNMYESNAPIGFAVDFGKEISTMGNGGISVVGEFGMNRFSADNFFDAENQFSYMGGVRFTAKGSGSSKARFFGQVLLGGLSSFDQNDFAMQPGGGVAFNIQENTDARVQIDFPIDFAEAKTFTGVRLNFGIVWWIGR